MEYEKPRKPEDLITFRKTVNKGGYSTSKIIETTQSLMCLQNRDDMVTVETPEKKVRQYKRLIWIVILAHVDTARYLKDYLDTIM